VCLFVLLSSVLVNVHATSDSTCEKCATKIGCTYCPDVSTPVCLCGASSLGCIDFTASASGITDPLNCNTEPDWESLIVVADIQEDCCAEGEGYTCTTSGEKFCILESTELDSDSLCLGISGEGESCPFGLAFLDYLGAIMGVAFAILGLAVACYFHRTTKISVNRWIETLRIEPHGQGHSSEKKELI